MDRFQRYLGDKTDRNWVLYKYLLTFLTTLSKAGSLVTLVFTSFIALFTVCNYLVYIFAYYMFPLSRL